MNPKDKPLAWIAGEIKTPPLSQEARVETGYLLRRLQRGESLSLPLSRPMPSIAPNTHELRITDKDGTWRIIYHLDVHSVVILEIFSKKSRQTPKKVIEVCQRRLKDYQDA